MCPEDAYEGLHQQIGRGSADAGFIGENGEASRRVQYIAWGRLRIGCQQGHLSYSGSDDKVPQGLKPSVERHVTAQLKLCPFKTDL